MVASAFNMWWQNTAPRVGDKSSVSKTFQFLGKLQVFLKCPVVHESSSSIKEETILFLILYHRQTVSNVSQEGCCCPIRHALPCVIPKLVRAKNGNKGILVQQHMQRMEMVLNKLRPHLKINLSLLVLSLLFKVFVQLMSLISGFILR